MGKFISLANKLFNRFNLDLSYAPIYPNEERLWDQRKIEEFLGMELPEVLGFQVLVKICVRGEMHYFRDFEGKRVLNDKGEEVKIIIPSSTRIGDNYCSNVGLVCAMGPNVFRSNKSRYNGPIYRVGDHITFSPSAGLLTPFKGLTFKMLIDEHAQMIVKDPEDVLMPLKRTEAA